MTTVGISAGINTAARGYITGQTITRLTDIVGPTDRFTTISGTGLYATIRLTIRDIAIVGRTCDGSECDEPHTGATVIIDTIDIRDIAVCNFSQISV